MPSLYTKGRILGHKRGKRNSRPNQSLVAIEGVDTKEAARSYLGKVGVYGTELLDWDKDGGQGGGTGGWPEEGHGNGDGCEESWEML